MTREIKFRSWDSKDRLMREKIEGRYWLGLEIDTGKLVNIEEGKVIDAPKDRIILMQFTGLHDKNGKEIWEGDVVKVPSHFEGDREYKDSVAHVYFSEESAEFQIDGRGCGYVSMFDFVNNYEGEVIGNIYENSNLLKDEAT